MTTEAEHKGFAEYKVTDVKTGVTTGFYVVYSQTRMSALVDAMARKSITRMDLCDGLVVLVAVPADKETAGS